MLSQKNVRLGLVGLAVAGIIGCGDGGSVPVAPSNEKDSAKIVPAEVKPSRAMTKSKKPATPATSEP